MREKFLHFMQGRYGADQLYRVMLIGGAVLVILSNFIFEVFFLLLGWILVRETKVCDGTEKGLSYLYLPSV